MSRIRKFLSFIWRNIDASLCLILAIAAGIMGIWGMKVNYVVSSIAGVLALLSYGILRDREIREKLNAKLLSFEVPPSTDNLFLEKSDEGFLIKKATSEIVLIQETGSKIFKDYRGEITNLLNNGGTVRCIIVQGQDENLINLMAFRNFDLYDIDLMKEQIHNGLEMIKLIQRNSKEHSKKLEIRFFPYPMDITGIFIDTKSKQNMSALVRLQGFKLKYEEKPTLKIYGLNSSRSFQLYCNQMENIWKFSTKCILLTGKPGVGKSTLLKKVVNKIEKLNKNKFTVQGFYTESIIKNNKRIGFKTITIDESKSDILTTREKGNYILVKKTMDDLIIPAMKEGIENPNTNLLIIDEIGPIQLQDKQFKVMIQRALNTHRISILGIIAQSNEDDDFIEEVLCNYRTSIVEVNIENRDKLIDEIVNEFV
jgi:nucleoside-triphosphatase